MPNAWKVTGDGEGLLAKAAAAAEKTIGPAAAAVDKDARFPKEGIEALRAAGLLGLVGGKDAGGHGQGMRTAAACVERVAQDCPSTAMIFLMHTCASAVLDKHGTPELRKATSGGKLATLAFSETGSRSAFWIPAGTAAKSGGSVKLDAEKQLITSAGVCDYYVWSSKPAAADGLSTIWAVPSNAAGLTITAKFEGMGLRGNGSSPISAKGVSIPEGNRLGEDGKGFDVMMGIVMPWFAVLSCAHQVGLMEGCFARATAHVSGGPKYAFDGSALSALPQVRQHVAKMRVKIDLVRGFLLDALDALESGRADAMLRVLECKVAGSETSLEVTDLAMRVCGGAAYRKDVAVERFFRDSRAATAMAPVTDALYDFIGKAVCGLPVFG